MWRVRGTNVDVMTRMDVQCSRVICLAHKLPTGYTKADGIGPRD